jgi:hypothetical protein
VDDASSRKQTTESTGSAASVCVANSARGSEPVEEKRESNAGWTLAANMVAVGKEEMTRKRHGYPGRRQNAIGEELP